MGCSVCGRALPPSGRGRPARYCSRACRARAYRDRVAERQQLDVDLPEEAAALTPERVVRAAIGLADREGVAALSMRRVAAELNAGPMSLYRYVRGKEELGGMMIDAVFGDRPLPEPGPAGWRNRLELSARREWEIYLDHAWVPQLATITTRPPLAPRMMAYTDWRIRAVDGLGLDFATMVRIAIMVSTHVQGAAQPLARERRERSTREEWLLVRRGPIRETFGSGALPMIERFDDDALRASEPDSVFEFGLRCLLDGVERLISS
ncbi:TetR/AcrR family transcriptional regulator [Amycolatopsis antarctica]|uniref:TetR/AcrR family transcriptional regulator n=1 Tax=Amycolatopsis antarctica TaxID=1854586 RepID=UPI0013FDC2B7|nr:TetR/AcrR family transcriptional regulator [Amycolatopsis antarctica]